MSLAVCRSKTNIKSCCTKVRNVFHQNQMDRLENQCIAASNPLSFQDIKMENVQRCHRNKPEILAIGVDDRVTLILNIKQITYLRKIITSIRRHDLHYYRLLNLLFFLSLLRPPPSWQTTVGSDDSRILHILKDAYNSC